VPETGPATTTSTASDGLALEAELEAALRTQIDVTAAVLEAVGSAHDPSALLVAQGDAIAVAWANRAFCDVVRAAVADLLEADAASVISTPFAELPLNELRSSTFPASILASDASITHWDAVAVPTLDAGGRAWLVSFRPRLSDRNLDELLHASEERFRALAERAPIGIFSSEVGLRLAYVNDFLADLLGVPAERLMGTGWMEFVAEADLDSLCNGLQATLTGAHYEAKTRFLTNDGEEKWVNIRAIPVVAPGSPAAFLGTVEDVTERRRFEDALAWQATHDPLTRLPNRTQLTAEITAALEQRSTDTVVMFFDLDDFKVVNDTLGHQTGDELLVTVATRLRTAVRDGDHVFRFGGDEFVVLSHGTDDAEALGVANRLRRSVAQPVVLDGHEFTVRCSVGVVRAVGDTTPVDLLRDADIAMYQAKRNGKSAVAMFDLGLRDERSRVARQEAMVCDAIDGRRLHLEYHPVVDVASGAPRAVEALLRWPDGDSDGDGALDAPALVAVAEATGRVAELTSLVLDQLTADLAAWRSDGAAAPEWVGIDLSPAQLAMPGLVDQVARSLLRHGLSGSDLCVELPEAAWVTAGGALDGVLAELVALGVRVVLDDVGASVSSLNSIAAAPVTGVKLDRSFFFQDQPTGRVVVRAVVGVARELGLDVVVEGIESPEDLAAARSEGSTLGQGVAFGHPVIAAAVPTLFSGGAGG
jgi:diguanylate cyclase (GGDEF)-like protein/PAS domain S-box-containing protein